jgi:hypothetical protein
MRAANETTVQVRLPDMPIPTKSKFGCFIVKWDGKTLGQFGCGASVNVVTDTAMHTLEIVQKNESFNPLKFWKVFDVNPSVTPVIQIVQDGKQFLM